MVELESSLFFSFFSFSIERLTPDQKVNICKWGLNHFRLFLCLSSGLVLKWMRPKWLCSSSQHESFKLSLRTCWRGVEKGCVKMREANEINLIIKKSHKMDWSHLEMPFVLSLFPSLFFMLFSLYVFSPICCRSALCVSIIFFPSPSFCRWLKGRKSIFFISDASSPKNEDWSRSQKTNK